MFLKLTPRFKNPGFKELANDGALLMYISADGCFSSSKQTDDCKYTCLNFISYINIIIP